MGGISTKVGCWHEGFKKHLIRRQRLKPTAATIGFVLIFNASEMQMRTCKTVLKSLIKIAFTQGGETFYAGKQPQILLKFALTLCTARS
jgi:hypothetical protein